jgi:hypothetical protein
LDWPRYVTVSLGAGLAAGLLAAGAGGRLMMRLLGATSSPDVHGLATEAGETIGEISVGGTLAFLVFVGLPAGFLSGLLYALLAPVLPSGRACGVALGVVLLVLFATRIEPLRPDSIDFLLLDPAWLAVLGFRRARAVSGDAGDRAGAAAQAGGALARADRRPRRPGRRAARGAARLHRGDR